MALFSRGGARQADLRARDYVLRGTSVVTADDRVVQVDLVLRFEPQPSRDGEHLGWDEADEDAVHAVVLTVLRLTGESLDRDALVAERSRLAGPVAHALALAPVATGFSADVTSLEVGEHVASSAGDHAFRVVA